MHTRQAEWGVIAMEACSAVLFGCFYLGVYHREAIEQAGGWDEGMLRAEDWDLNYRIRARGGQIWFTPHLRVT